ncbi:MAG: hypothetical protein IJS67_02390 [Clostridia bacterium]|nr:hypothetical protein [Clostridia bacterium]
MVKKEESAQATPAAEEEKKSAKFYPDIEFNKKERRKTVLMFVLLVFFMGGLGLTTLLGGVDSGMSMMTGIIMLAFVGLGIATVPSAFKQYPVKNEPIIEVNAKTATINGKTVKISDIYEVRLTVTLPTVGKKEENEKFLAEIAKKEPERNMTANFDVVLKKTNEKQKDNVLYSTVANAYECLVAFYMAGCKHYKILYSMKKQTALSEYDLGNFVTKEGTKLSEVSKKDRKRQLY